MGRKIDALDKRNKFQQFFNFCPFCERWFGNHTNDCFGGTLECTIEIEEKTLERLRDVLDAMSALSPKIDMERSPRNIHDLIRISKERLDELNLHRARQEDKGFV